MRHRPAAIAPALALLAGQSTGCLADLLPGELVVGADLPAQRWDGAPDERFGASIAVGAGGAWATAAGVPELRRLDASDETALPATWTGQAGGHVYAAAVDGRWWIDGEEQAGVGVGVTWAAGGLGVAFADSAGWALPERGVSVAMPRVSAIAVGDARVLAMADGVVYAWDADGGEIAITLTGGEGGALGEWEGAAWAGAPQDDIPDGEGQVCNELGDCIVGLVGDHLGRVIGGGYAAGTFNKWVVPARARYVPLDGGPVLAVDEGAEDQPLSVAGDETTAWLGAPYFAQGGLPGGVVLAVDRP